MADLGGSLEALRDAVRRYRLLSRLCPILLLLGLSGCGGESHGQIVLSRYSERLATALDQPLQLPGTPQAPPLPRVAGLQHVLERQSLDMLDMLTLHGCSLQVTVGKINSSLGRTAPPSQRLLLELEFLREAPACIERLVGDGEAELAAHLHAAVAQKQSQLDLRIWNATLGAEELRRLWRPSGSARELRPGSGSSAGRALASLQAHVESWQSGDYRVTGPSLESLLGELRTGPGGLLLRAWSQQQHYLGSATEVAKARIARVPLCFNGRASPEGRVLDNVVRRYFIGEVQPWLVAIRRESEPLMLAQQGLEQRLRSVMPAGYARWADWRDALYQRVATLPADHVAAIRPLLASCGLAPGQEVIRGAPAGVTSAEVTP